jgi:hypothetical protein
VEKPLSIVMRISFENVRARNLAVQESQRDGAMLETSLITYPESPKVTESQSHRVTESQSHRVTESQSHRVTEAQRHRGTEAQRHRVTEAQRHRGTEAQRHRGARERVADSNNKVQCELERVRDSGVGKTGGRRRCGCATRHARSRLTLQR